MIRYVTETQQLDIAGLDVQLQSVVNIDELYEQLIAKGPDHEDVVDERIPYWAQVWPSAIGLGQHLVTHELISPGVNVLEIGCGLGLSGIVAGLLGGKVTLTDYLPEAISFALSNWKLNLQRPVQTALLDWRLPDPDLAADIVLAADVAYEKRAHAYLPNAFRTLCKPDGLILVSDPGRSASGEFFKNLPDQGFLINKYTYKVGNTTVTVYALRPC